MPTPATRTDPFDLLVVLDAVVRRDRGYPGFGGSVAVGVRAGDQERWWSAELHGDAKSTITDRPPENAHALLLIGGAEADAILDHGALPPAPELCVIEGDRDLLRATLKRYLAPSGMVSLRSSLSREHKPTKRTTRRPR